MLSPVLRKRLYIERIYQASTRRHYAIQSTSNPSFQVFDTTQKHIQRTKSAFDKETSRATDYIRDEVADRLTGRLLDINRHFPRVLDYGAGSGSIAKSLAKDVQPTTTSQSTIDSEDIISKSTLGPLSKRVSHLVQTDNCSALLDRDSSTPLFPTNITPPFDTSSHTLPFNTDTDLSPLFNQYGPSSFDAIVSSMSLHWTNDLPSLLSSFNTLLKPDCPFIAALPGGDTLYELRGALQVVEQDRLGGVIGTHISPFVDVSDIGGLLSKAGFGILTVDVDEIVVEYPSVFELLMDLQAMGEGNAIINKNNNNGNGNGNEKIGLRRDVLIALDAAYRAMYGDEQGNIPATFRIIYMIGWKAGGDQKKPLQRGSGQISLKHILEGKTKI